MSKLFSAQELAHFWDDDEYATQAYESEPVTSALISDIEQQLGYTLPAAYIELMSTQNGGAPRNTCVPTAHPTSWADDHVAITCLFGIGRQKAYSLCGDLGSRFMMNEWDYPNIGVYIGDCPSAGHDMIALDYRQCGHTGEPSVVHVDQEADYKITPLANNFAAFVRLLTHQDVYE